MSVKEWFVFGTAALVVVRPVDIGRWLTQNFARGTLETVVIVPLRVRVDGHAGSTGFL